MMLHRTNCFGRNQKIFSLYNKCNSRQSKCQTPLKRLNHASETECPI